MTTYYDYRYHREAPGDYQVWLYSSLTGDRKSFVRCFRASKDAARFCRERNK